MLLFNIVSQLDNIIQLGKLLSYDCNQKKAHPQMEQSNGVTIDTNTELQEYINKATTEALENYNDKR